MLKVGNKFGFAKVMKLLQTSPDRQELPNEDLLRTGIAPLSHLKYEKQLAFKQQQVENVLAKSRKCRKLRYCLRSAWNNLLATVTKRKFPFKNQRAVDYWFYRKIVIPWCQSKISISKIRRSIKRS